MLESFITLCKFILLGLVQGITEPLPISSSGHLVLLRSLFDIHTANLSFEIIVHFGSLIAIILIFWRDIIQLGKESILYILTQKDHYKVSFHFSSMLIVATIVTGGLGLLLEPFIQESLTTPFIIGIAFLITSFFLWMIRHLEGHKTGWDITIKTAIFIGLAQGLALFPGISRSGATIVGAMLLGLTRETALRFSFLLFIPVSIGVNLLSYRDILQIIETNQLAIPYFLAFLASILATFYALKLFIQVMLRGKLIIFSLYCFILGILVLFLPI